MMDGECVDAENRDQEKDNGDIYTDPVFRCQPLVRYDESNGSNSDDDLEIPDLEESLSMLKEEGDEVGVLFHSVHVAPSCYLFFVILVLLQDVVHILYKLACLRELLFGDEDLDRRKRVNIG